MISSAIPSGVPLAGLAGEEVLGATSRAFLMASVSENHIQPLCQERPWMEFMPLTKVARDSK